VYEFTKGKRLRKPTEIIVATDGFCASGCAFFTYNALRSGSAIIAGYGGILPNEDPRFVLGQLFATTVDHSQFIDELSNNSKYGFTFFTSYAEMYNVSEKMDELIPNEFDTPRIDENLYYFENVNPVLEDILSKTQKVYEKYKTSCNPYNKRLINIADCHVDDPNALAVGHICGDDGKWDKNTCKILTCQPMYTVDNVNNKCIPNSCDGRSVLFSSSSSTSPSSSHKSASMSNTVCPMLGLVMAIISFFFFF